MAPKAQTIRAAVAGGFWTAADGVASTAPSTGGDWPMTATVYAVMRREGNSAQKDRALTFFRYFYAETPRQADALGFITLPPEVVSEVEAHWAADFQPQS